MSNNLVITYKKEPFEHIIFENFFSEEELPIVHREIEFYTSNDLLSAPLDDRPATGNSLDEHGKSMAKRKSAFLGSIFVDFRRSSKIYQFTKKIYSKQTKAMGTLGRLLNHSNNDATLLSLYTKGDFYLPHFDKSAMTLVTYIWDKQIPNAGGELYFPEFDYSYDCRHNSAVLFLSAIDHGVKELTADVNRFAITTFLGVCNTI